MRGSEINNLTNFSETEIPSNSTTDRHLDTRKLGVVGVIIVLTVIGNLIVIVAISLRNMKMTRMYYFILHLSLSDLLTAFFTLLPEFIWTVTGKFYGGFILCKIVKFVQMIGPYLSSYVLIMTAIDRYHAICFPLSNCAWTPKRSKIMIGIAWLISLVLCLPQIFIFGGDNCVHHFEPFWGQKAYVTWFSFSNFFFPLIILIYCYCRITYAIWDNFNSKTAERGNSPWWKECLGTKKEVRYRWRASRNNRYGSDEESDESQSPKNTKIIVEPPSNEDATTSFMNTKQKSVDSGNSTETMKVPRSSSVKGISRAKIKTVKLTLVVIFGYILCSAPFNCAQLWVSYNPASTIGQSVEWLFWLLTLNSVINPWIYMFFNSNLVESLYRTCCACEEIPFQNGRPNLNQRKNGNRASPNRFLSTAVTSHTVLRSRSNSIGSGNIINHKSFEHSTRNSPEINSHHSEIVFITKETLPMAAISASPPSTML